MDASVGVPDGVQDDFAESVVLDLEGLGEDEQVGRLNHGGLLGQGDGGAVAGPGLGLVVGEGGSDGNGKEKQESEEVGPKSHV
jgi:hypothetical protein